MMGILITSQAISKEEYLMDLELSKGIYQVKIGSLTKKLVIE
jgi:phage host-nuclease inhibitor protein Gam